MQSGTPSKLQQRAPPNRASQKYSRDKNPLSGSQGPATNPEGKNITEPTGSPTKASPNGPEK
jgi:hypothetical protein